VEVAAKVDAATAIRRMLRRTVFTGFPKWREGHQMLHSPDTSPSSAIRMPVWRRLWAQFNALVKKCFATMTFDLR